MISQWSSRNLSRSSSSHFNFFISLIVSMAILIPLSHGYIHRNPQNVENNDISDIFNDVPVIPRDDDRPLCHEESICASLQTNARGVQVTPLCRCRGPHRCPMHWDPFDGHSITQESWQYKFCERAPVLPTCSLNDIAYTSKMGYSKTTRDLVSSTDRIACRCPDMHNYEAADHSYAELDDEVDIFETKYICQRMPQCKPATPCKAVTITAESFLVNAKCVCPDNLSCPTITSNKMEGMPFGKGKVEFIPCQEIK